MTFGGLVLGLILAGGFLLFLRWIVRRLFAFREQIDLIEEPSNFWDRLLYRFLKFIVRLAEGVSHWLERKSAFFAGPCDPTRGLPVIVLFILCLLGILFLNLGSKYPDQGIWTILAFFCIMPGIFELLLPKKKEGEEKTLEYEMTWGGFAVYLILFEILTLLVFFALIAAIGWVIASNTKSTPSGVAGHDDSSVSEVSEAKVNQSNAMSSSEKETPKASSSSSEAKSNSRPNNQVASNTNKASHGQVITVECPKCGNSVAVNCRGVNGQSSDTGHCRNCGRLVYVLYENSSFGFRIIRVW